MTLEYNEITFLNCVNISIAKRTHLSKLEQSERRSAVVRIITPEYRVYLGIKASVAEPEEEAAEHRKVRRGSYVGDLVGIAEGRDRWQVDEDQEEAGQVDDVAHDNDRIPTPARRLAAENTEHGTTCK